MERSYHHGDLRQALLNSAFAVLAEKGVESFSLRETARRAGVSPAAPKHHFADTRALLTALAAIAFSRLAESLATADASAGREPRDRLQAQGAAYVGFALSERALFDLMWRTSLLDLSSPDLLAQKARAFGILDGLIRGVTARPLANDDPEMARTIACWSLVHGFACLALGGGFGQEGRAQAHMAEAVLPTMLGLLNVLD